MSRFLKYISIVFITALTSCFEREVFSDTPKIFFEDIVFYDGTNTDSLILTFSFEDGNGDIGVIESQDILPPYNEFNVYLDSRDSVVTKENINRAVPPIYTAPLMTKNYVLLRIENNTIFLGKPDSGSDYPVLAFFKTLFSDKVADIPLVCPGLTNEEGTFLNKTTLTPYILSNNSNLLVASPVATAQVISSTLPIQRVERRFNFIIEFQQKVGDDYVPLNYQKIFGTNRCDIGIFNGRIPQYNPDGKSGVFTYSIQSSALRLAFLDHVIRAKFYVYDRAGNKSNEAVTSDFFLADITQ